MTVCGTFDLSYRKKKTKNNVNLLRTWWKAEESLAVVLIRTDLPGLPYLLRASSLSSTQR